MRALVLTGGGALGAYEAGVICGLAETGQHFDLVCGTSIGAINAAFYAQGLIEELEGLWKTIAGKNIVTLSPTAQRVMDFVSELEAVLKLNPALWAFHVLGLIKKYKAMGPLPELMAMLGALDRSPVTALLQPVLNFDNIRCSLVVTGTNVNLQTSESFFAFAAPAGGTPTAVDLQKAFLANAKSAHPITAENYLVAVEASGSLPFAFPPMSENLGSSTTYLYVDGGVANNSPIGLAINAGATDITVIFMTPASNAPLAAVPNVAVLGLACYTVMQQKILEDDMKLALMTNQAVAGRTAANDKLGLQGKVEVSLRQVRPVQPLALSVLGFNDQPAIDEAFELGRSDAKGVKTVWERA
ncbi:MAG TPA: patatin-like phospholipase family protein [Candidatus Baltobacteraceae bacterium]|nr:patatin-like phospholipase family protein [Candidatus Baltobacteraceae bacterium]